eukprot:NODE_342_length_10579_cov_0.629389.p3 type:complete len:222 gc:universal NODE_342_length_10579_cov_0.629389:252-917(+)
MTELQMSNNLKIGSKAPDFDAETSHGKMNFYEALGNKWTIFFSHPKDSTPVCTTEVSDLAKHAAEFDKRGFGLIGLSCDDLESHKKWLADIEKYAECKVEFPLIADEDRSVATKFDMLQDPSNVDDSGKQLSVRSVFFIDPNKTIRAMLFYPAAIGRNTLELLRIADGLLQLDKFQCSTPANWTPGKQIVVPPSMKGSDLDKYKNVKEELPYLKLADDAQQ